MAWNYCPGEFEESECSCLEAQPEYDEDAAYQEARDDRAGFNDWGGWGND